VGRAAVAVAERLTAQNRTAQGQKIRGAVEELPMIEKEILIETDGGNMQTYVCHPERGSHPIVVIYMDAFGVREELRELARRIGTAGYYVMLPNLYHRMGVHELGPLREDVSGADLEHLTACVQSLSIPLVMRDTVPLLAYADSDEASGPGSIACLGYCMSGRFAVGAAAQFPDRVRAAGSLYGTWLASDDPMSPHRAGSRAPGELYFACAEDDHWAPLEDVHVLSRSLEDAKANAEVEIYWGTRHAFAFKSRSTYDRVADDRHWERIFALLKRNLC
jgi:carboxymethylenebutenolidase